MAGWGEYAAAWAVFLLTHAVPVRPPVRPWLVARLGHAGYGVGYSALSIVVLVWLVGAAGRAPYLEIWPRAEWQNHVTLAAMTLACLIIALAAFRPNPLSFGGWHNARFDPDRPGIVGLIRHPFLAALGLWALGHVVPNGDLAHVLMFGGFAVFAALGMHLVDRRRQKSMGTDEWLRLVHRLSPRPDADPLRWISAGAIVGVLILLHPVVIGLPAIW